MSREIFFVSGIGLERLVATSLTFGFFFLAHMEGSFQETEKRVFLKSAVLFSISIYTRFCRKINNLFVTFNEERFYHGYIT